jgi:hypothetical protein
MLAITCMYPYNRTRRVRVSSAGSGGRAADGLAGVSWKHVGEPPPKSDLDDRERQIADQFGIAGTGSQ